MKTHSTFTRRGFIRTAAASSLALSWLSSNRTASSFGSEASKPALLGGTPVHTGGWAKWPEWSSAWEEPVLKVFRSCHWFRGSAKHVEDFEEGYAKLLGAK